MNIDYARETAAPQAAGPRGPRGAGAPAPAVHSAAARPAARPVDAAEVDAAIDAANQAMQGVATNLRFEKDSASGKTVVRVIDSETQQVLRQMPSEEMLAMSKALSRLHGLMVHLKV